MKLLFVYNHASHAEPLLRCSAHMKPRFEILPRAISASPTDAQVNEVLRGPFDALLLQEPPVSRAILDQVDKPIVLLERIDGGQLRASRELLATRRVAAVIKGYTYRSPKLHNRTYDRAHVEMLAKAGVTAEKPRHRNGRPQYQLDAASLAAIHAGYGFGARLGFKRFVRTFVDMDAPRPIDVSMQATVDYERSEIESHRWLAIEVLKQWRERYPQQTEFGTGVTLSLEAYACSMLRSKAVLCPWGWGESTHRDYEAMALGSIVIKPDTTHIHSWPDIYWPGKTHVACLPDFSDAHEKIAHVRDHWESYRSMREFARSLVVEAWEPQQVAQRMTGILQVILG